MQDAATSRPAEGTPAALGRRSWSLLILVCVAQFMVIVDMTVVNVALPSIGRALRFASPADLQWVVTAYVLVSGGLVLLGGRTADLLGAPKARRLPPPCRAGWPPWRRSKAPGITHMHSVLTRLPRS